MREIALKSTRIKPIHAVADVQHIAVTALISDRMNSV